MTKLKPKFKLSPLEEKYLKLSEVYLAKYEDLAVKNIKIMLAKGVIVEMESDLAFYHLDKPRTDKSEAQLQRLNVLRSTVEEFADIHSFNYQIHQLLGRYHRENAELEKKIKTLEEGIQELLLKKDLDVE